MKRGRKSRIDKEAIIQFARDNPLAYQKDIAEHFAVCQYTVSRALTSVGIKGQQTGRPIKRKAGVTDEQHAWEQALQAYGLGMGRGLRLGGKCLYYGYDPAKQELEDESATRIANF